MTRGPSAVERTVDALARGVAGARSRREAIRIAVSVLFGGAAAGCDWLQNPSEPSCSGCIGTDGRCYTCEVGFCTTNPSNLNCSAPSEGGIYCCTSVTGGGSNCLCGAGQTYNFLTGVCCPNSEPYYYPGTHGIVAAGCKSYCPYVGDCGDRWQRC